MMRRVVVTGLGMVTPLGNGVEATWSRLVEGQSGANGISDFQVDDLACRIACQIPRGDGSDGTFNADQWMEPKEQRKVDPFIVYGMAAATQALQDSGWKPTSYEDQCATGVLIGSGIGGIGGIYEASATLIERGPAPHLALLHPRPPHQPGGRLRVHRARAEGSEPCGGDGLLHRLATPSAMRRA
jgi:3-oxoacyl-[acyl-carrier-protein] synthase II